MFRVGMSHNNNGEVRYTTFICVKPIERVEPIRRVEPIERVEPINDISTWECFSNAKQCEKDMWDISNLHLKTQSDIKKRFRADNKRITFQVRGRAQNKQYMKTIKN
jgi:hypothetical protein